MQLALMPATGRCVQTLGHNAQKIRIDAIACGIDNMSKSRHRKCYRKVVVSRKHIVLD